MPLVVGSPLASSSVGAAAAAGEGEGAPVAGAGDCTPTTCNGHGVCLPPTGSACFCNSGYVGATCSKCSVGRENYPACTAVAWRDSFLIEYYPIENYRNQPNQRVNDCPANTFRALRFHNDTTDLVYAEITTLEDWFFTNITFRELYDMRVDPFQLVNVYDDASEDTRLLLKSRLADVYGCKGAACP